MAGDRDLVERGQADAGAAKNASPATCNNSCAGSGVTCSNLVKVPFLCRADKCRGESASALCAIPFHGENADAHGTLYNTLVGPSTFSMICIRKEMLSANSLDRSDVARTNGVPQLHAPTHWV